MDFNDPALYERHRAVAHECGHVTAAWLSPIVVEIECVRFEGTGGETKLIYLNKDTSDVFAERVVIALAGMAGEGLVWGRIRSGGCDNDLSEAYEFAEKLTRLTTIESLRRQWRDSGHSKVNVASMFAQPPPPPVSETLNLGYRRARSRIINYRAGFDRMCVLAAGKDIVTREEIQSQFGPRPWAP